VKPGGTMKLFTNQFSMRLSDDLQVYQYELSVTPDVMTDSYIIQNVLRTIRRKMEAILGLYVVSG
jgi:hypothetical protein